MKMRIGRNEIKAKFEFDTWGCPKNYDKLMTNITRIIGIGLVVVVFQDFFHPIINLSIYAVGLLLAGVTEIVYFRHDRKKFEFFTW